MPTKKTAAKKTTLVQKMHLIMQDLAFIKKDAKNTNAHYTYASERVIKIALHDALVKHGVLFKMSASNPRTLELKNSNGTLFSTVIDTHYQFINVDDKEDILEGTCLGSGNGRDDKGLYSAITGALKYTLTSMFLIPTGDDAEADGNRPVDAYIPAENEAQTPKEEPESNEPPAPAEPPVSEPPASEPPATKKKVAKKKVAKKKVAKKPDPKFIWGEPEGNPVMSEKDKNNVLKAFGKFDINEGELEAVSGMPIMEWTANIKEVALNNFNSLVDGTYAKEDVVEL